MSDLCAFDKVLYKILGGPVFARQNIIIQLLIDCCTEIIRALQKIVCNAKFVSTITIGFAINQLWIVLATANLRFNYACNWINARPGAG